MTTPNQTPSTDENSEEAIVASDVTGEKSAQKAFDDAKEAFKLLVSEIFATEALRADGDLIDMLSDEMHEILDNELTAYYNSTNPMDDEDLDEDDIDESMEP